MVKQKKKKKRRLKISSVFISLFFIFIISIIIYFIRLIPCRGYYIYNNKYYSDEEILEILKLDDNTSYLLTNQVYLNSLVKKNKLIKKIRLQKTMTLEFKIYVEENRIMFYDTNINKTVLSNGEKIDLKDNDTILLTSKIEDKKLYKKLYTKMNKIDEDVMPIISEIKYDKNDVDDERFLFSMNDGNYVYITLSKMRKINNYGKIVESIKDQKGILYLDYGNYFVPKE